MVDARPLPLAAMSTDTRAPFTVLDEVLCTVLATGLVLVALWPAARGMTALGWLPLWLVGMPAAAWWAVRGFPVPGRRRAQEDASGMRRAVRHTGPQARRRARAPARVGARRAA